jgi:hypothetical protein
MTTIQQEKKFIDVMVECVRATETGKMTDNLYEKMYDAAKPLPLEVILTCCEMAAAIVKEENNR